MNTLITWKELGYLSKDETFQNISTDDKQPAVYLFVYNNEKIIYVGETDNVLKRLKEHIKLFTTGGRTCFRVSNDVMNKGKKIYELMTLNRMLTLKSDQFEYYRKLSASKAIWIPSNDKSGKYWNSLYKEENNNFESDWLPYVRNDYLPRTRVWVAEFIDSTELMRNKEIRIALESQIQDILRKGLEYDMGYYTNSKQWSWLGKQEIIDREELNKFTFTFVGYPIVDKSTKEQLESKFSN